MYFAKASKGFTLIELLVVIAIIAILSVIGMTQLGRAREKARDSQRRIDLSQVQHQLTSYFDDHNGRYPLTTDFSGDPVVPDQSRTTAANPTGIFSSGGALVPDYLKNEVIDPLRGFDGHEYFYTANCDTSDCSVATTTGAKDYVLYTVLEVGNFIYALGPSGRIADVSNQFTNIPTCPGATSGDATLACAPPS